MNNIELFVCLCFSPSLCVYALTLAPQGSSSKNVVHAFALMASNPNKKYVSNLEKPKYLSWLIVKGFKQEHGVYYDEIFSPVRKMTALRVLLGVVATEYLELEQLDVKMTFLHGDFQEDIYMS